MFAVNAWTYPVALALRQLTGFWRSPQVPREWLARAIFPPNCQRAFPFCVRTNGIIFRGDFHEYLDWRIFFLGGFERESINLCRFLSRYVSSRVFLDIGANKGLYSLMLSSSFSEIIAFEPLEGNILKFKNALQENAITNVEIVSYALGDRDENALFYVPPYGNEGVGSLVQGHIKEPGKTQTVRVRRGDEFCLERNLSIGMLKVDTEGFEWSVLTGLKVTLERDRPFVLFEIGDSSKQAFREGGGVHSVLPPNYTVFQVSDHSITRQFYLKPLSDGEILERGITNNLACPIEKTDILTNFVRKP